MRKEGKLVPASYDEAIHRAAEILANANYPILYGWSSTDCEAQRVGVELAEEVGGVMDNTSVVCHGPSILSVQEVGIPTCTLGQIRHRADLIIYWGCNPWSSHPRHLERYTSFTEGRFEGSEWKSYINKVKASAGRKKLRSLERQGALRQKLEPIVQTVSDNKPPATLSKEGRKLIVIDVRKSMTAEMADYFIQVEPGKDYELMLAIRALVKDQELDVDEVAGVPVEYLQELVDAMISCEFGVIFFGMGLTQSTGKFRNVDVAISLIRDLNMRTKFAIMPMRGHFNVTGANTVLTWQSGYPYAVDFSLGYPRYNPGETTVVDILLRKESDAALVIASDPASNFPRKAVEHIVKNPLIVIDPHMNVTALVGDVVFPSAIVGIEKAGTAYRMDHVPLPLKKVVEPPEGIRSDEEILHRILEEVRLIKSQKTEAA
jgi:formylmethanofuran dehydrogenase subunit B